MSGKGSLYSVNYSMKRVPSYKDFMRTMRELYPPVTWSLDIDAQHAHVSRLVVADGWLAEWRCALTGGILNRNLLTVGGAALTARSRLFNFHFLLVVVLHVL